MTAARGDIYRTIYTNIASLPYRCDYGPKGKKPRARKSFRIRAGNGTRTRDPNLGKVVLYQLSYSREEAGGGRRGPPRRPDPLNTQRGPRRFAVTTRPSDDGGEGNRTPDLLNAIQALSQLSYAPAVVTVDLRS